MQQAVLNIHERRAAHKKKRWERLLFLYSFLMAFPSILFLGQNASVLVFGAIILFLLQHSKRPLLGLAKPVQWFALLFAIGALLSVANIPKDASTDALERAFGVLPNYLYWSILIIIIVQHRQLINLEVIYKAAFWGVISTMIYYLFLQQILRTLPIFNTQTPNTFAFVLICYTPFAIYHLKEQNNRGWAFVFLLIVVLILLRDGRRAGMVLVLLGGLAVLYGDGITWKKIIAIVVVIPLFWLILFSKPIESFVAHSNERIYELIYQTEKIQSEDHSYLTRVAMIKKAMAIYDKYPYTGIGLTNFSIYTINFDKSFKGADLIAYKKDVQRTSPHNSYIGILAEGGLFHFIPFISILLIPILHLILNFKSLPKAHRPVFYALIMMSIHLYFIMAIVNVFAWFLIGLASALIYRKY